MSDLLDKPAAIRSGEELDTQKLELYLRRHFPDETGEVHVRQYPSGHSNLTYAMQFGAWQLVLRRPPFGSKVKSAHDMSREFRVLSKLHAVYPPAPEVVLYCDDAGVLGEPFYVMHPIHGVILRKELPPGLSLSAADARQLCESFVDNLIRLHRVDYQSAGLSDLGKPEGYLQRQVLGWIERYHKSATHDYVEVRQISEWMQRHMPVSSPASIIHNDYKFDNIVLDAHDVTRIVGVLDWEMCTIGDPLTDLGTALAYWADPSDDEELKQNLASITTQPGSFSRSELLDVYSKKSGMDVSRMNFYLAFARFKVAVIVQQIFFRYQQGLTKDPRFLTLPERVAALMRASLLAAQTSGI